MSKMKNDSGTFLKNIFYAFAAQITSLMMSILISIVPAKVDIIIGECDDAKLSLLQAVFSDRINIV